MLRETVLTMLCIQFAEKFQEVKEAATSARDKSQEKIETSSNHSQVSGWSVNQSECYLWLSLSVPCPFWQEMGNFSSGAFWRSFQLLVCPQGDACDMLWGHSWIFQDAVMGFWWKPVDEIRVNACSWPRRATLWSLGLNTVARQPVHFCAGRRGPPEGFSLTEATYML